MIPRNVSRRRQVFARLTLAAVLLAGLFAAHRAVFQPSLIPQAVIAAEAESQFNRQLDQFVKLPFDRPVMLKSWLEEWSRQTGIPVEVRHPAEFSSHEVSTSEVTLELPELPARQALDSLGERYGAAWEQQAHERIILHWYRRNAIEMQDEIATYPAPDFLAANFPT